MDNKFMIMLASMLTFEDILSVLEEKISEYKEKVLIGIDSEIKQAETAIGGSCAMLMSKIAAYSMEEAQDLCKKLDEHKKAEEIGNQILKGTN